MILFKDYWASWVLVRSIACVPCAFRRGTTCSRDAKKARVVSLARVCQSFCVLPALLSVSVSVFPELVSSGWCGLSRSSSGSSSTPFSRCSSWFEGCSCRTCLFEVVDPQPFSVLSPPVMGRRDREEGFLGRDPEALTSRRDRGRSRSTARLPSTGWLLSLDF